MRNFRNLEIWQRSLGIARSAFELTSSSKNLEFSALGRQIQKSAISIPSNIAEGCAQTNRSFLNYLRIALGSCYELETQLMLLGNYGFSNNEMNHHVNELQELEKMISGYMRYLKSIPN